jgi:glycosyltransferase 2 family protein
LSAPELVAEEPGRLVRWLHGGLRLVVPVVVLGFLWNIADGPGALALLKNPDWRWLALAFVAVNLQTIVSAWRWHRVALRLGLAIPPRQAVSEYYLAQIVNLSLPGGVVGDAARAVRARHGAGLGTAIRAVVIERMAGQIALFAVLIVAVVGSVIVPGGLALELDSRYLLLGLGAALVVGFAMVVAARQRRWRWPSHLLQASRQSLVARGAWIEQSTLGLVIVVLNLFSFALCALATGTVLSAEAILVLVPLILSAMLIPATIGGWGFREGAAAALFPLAGASASAGFATSVAFGLVILAASLPGLPVLLQARRPLPYNDH